MTGGNGGGWLVSDNLPLSAGQCGVYPEAQLEVACVRQPSPRASRPALWHNCVFTHRRLLCYACYVEVNVKTCSTVFFVSGEGSSS